MKLKEDRSNIMQIFKDTKNSLPVKTQCEKDQREAVKTDQFETLHQVVGGPTLLQKSKGPKNQKGPKIAFF